VDKEKGVVVEDLSLKNLFIETSWAAILPHLKFVLASKGLSFYFRATTDEFIKRVFVGAEAYKSKSLKDRDTETYFNSLDDLLGEMYDLVILRFGALGHTNRAAAGATHEALMIRETLRKPTWLISTPDRPFESSFAYSTELDLYIDKHFTRMSLDSTNHPDEVVGDAPGMSIVEDEVEPPAEENILVPDDVHTASGSNEDFSAAFGGDSKKKPGKKKPSSGPI
jgi:hypothetical protein